MTRAGALAALIAVNVLWGSTYVVAKVAMMQVPPTLLAALRFVLATLALFALLTVFDRWRGSRAGPLTSVAPADRRRLLALGALGIGAAYALEYPGLNLTTATDASLMIIGEVVFTTLLAALLMREAVSVAKLAGILTGAAGVVVLVGGHLAGADGADGIARATGDLLILAALALQSLYTVLGTGLSRRYHPLTVVAWAYAGSMVVWVPVLVWYLLFEPWPRLDAWGVLGVVHLALVASVLCFVMWFSASRLVGAGVAALSLFVQPLVGATLGVLLLGEGLTASTLAGGLLVLAAVLLTARAASGDG